MQNKELTEADIHQRAKEYADSQFSTDYDNLSPRDKDDWNCYFLGCYDGLKMQQKELEQLQAWKESAMQVMPDYKAIAKLIGVKLGQSVHDKIVPYLEKMQQREVVMKEMVEVLETCAVWVPKPMNILAQKELCEIVDDVLTKYNALNTSHTSTDAQI